MSGGGNSPLVTLPRMVFRFSPKMSATSFKFIHALGATSFSHAGSGIFVRSILFFGIKLTSHQNQKSNRLHQNGQASFPHYIGTRTPLVSVGIYDGQSPCLIR